MSNITCIKTDKMMMMVVALSWLHFSWASSKVGSKGDMMMMMMLNPHGSTVIQKIIQIKSSKLQLCDDTQTCTCLSDTISRTISCPSHAQLDNHAALCESGAQWTAIKFPVFPVAQLPLTRGKGVRSRLRQK